MFYSLDRFEGKFAVLQDDNGKSADVERKLLPPDAQQGDVLVICDGKWKHDREETKARRARILELQRKLMDQ